MESKRSLSLVLTVELITLLSILPHVRAATCSNPRSLLSTFIVPEYVSKLLLYQTLTTGSSFMPDLGASVHHMYHSATTSYNPNGISYYNARTQLRSDPLAAFKFPSEFFLSIYVNPSSDDSMYSYDIVFLKRTSSMRLSHNRSVASKYFVGVGVRKFFGFINLLVITSAGMEVILGYTLDANTPTRIGISRSGQTFTFYKESEVIKTITNSDEDEENFVRQVIEILDDVPGKGLRREQRLRGTTQRTRYMVRFQHVELPHRIFRGGS